MTFYGSPEVLTGTLLEERIELTLSVTTEFRHEYEQERAAWLRRRVLWYTGVIIGITAVSIAFYLVLLFLTDFTHLQQQLTIGISILSVSLYFLAFIAVLRSRMSREPLLRLVVMLIVANGAIGILSTPIILELTRNEVLSQVLQTPNPQNSMPQQAVESAQSDGVVSDADPEPVTDNIRSQDVREEYSEEEIDRAIAQMVIYGNSIGSIFLWHFVACLFLPWSPRESLRPIVPLLVLNALVTLYYIRLAPIASIVLLVLSPLVAAPGMAICWWRTSRFRDRFGYRMLRGRYGELKQELSTARSIHETLFPRPNLDGSLRFTYEYQPMRQIGGDYLYARKTGSAAEECLDIVLLDVTGHGITAALTVNRLVGEIEREFGKHPDTRPGDLLKGLNDYLHHSLARHSVYASALCIKIDKSHNELRWASAGHPPAFIKTADGRIDRLNSTAFLLGACHEEDFVAGEESIVFGPGDALVAYTDGATEAVNRDGVMLRLDGLQRIVAGCMEQPLSDQELGWCRGIVEAIDKYRGGPTQDDLLVVHVWSAL